MSSETRFIGDLLGSYVLASRAATTDGARVFACRSRSISAREVVMTAPVIGAVGERLSLSFQELGRLRGRITRQLGNGFAAAFELGASEHQALESRIAWLKRRALRVVSDRRQHKRVLPRDTGARLVLGQGQQLDCMIIDMSRSGVAISADIVLSAGMLVAVGSVSGRVVRPIEGGFAIQFGALQDLERLEGLLTLKTGAQRVEAARRLGLLDDQSATA